MNTLKAIEHTVVCSIAFKIHAGEVYRETLLLLLP